MTPNSIDALLEALKRNESSSKDAVDFSGDDKAPAASASSMGDSASDSDIGDMSDTGSQDQAEGEDAEHNAAVVAVLQSDYPNIYAKIAKQVGTDDDEGDQSDPSDAMSAMGDMMGSK